MCLQFAHCQQTFTNTSKFDQTHPLVFSILLPFNIQNGTVQFSTYVPYLLLQFGVYHCDVQYLRRRVKISRPSYPIAFVFMFFLILRKFFQDQGFVMGVEDFERRFNIVDLILCLDGIQKILKLNQSTAFLFDKNNLTHSPEIGKDIINAVVIILLWKGSCEQYLRWAVLQHKLLRIRVYNCLRFSTVYFCSLFPNTEFLTLHSYFSELFINIHEVVERTVILGFFCGKRLRFILIRCRTQIVVLLNEAIIILRNQLLRVYGDNIILESAPTFPVRLFVRKWCFLQLLLLFQGLIVDTSKVIVLKLNVLQFRTKNIHFTTILKDDLIIQIMQSLLCLINLGILNKCLPHFGLLKDEYFDD